MKHTRQIILVILGSLFSGVAAAQPILKPALTSDTAEASLVASQAGAALTSFRVALTPDKVTLFGFQDTTQAQSTTLGIPWGERKILLQPLRAYSGDTAGLISGFERIVYPITIGDTTKSSLVMTKGGSGGSWRGTQYGEVRFARLVDSMRNAFATVYGTTPPSFYVVRVPPLNRAFLAYNTASEFRMIALYTDLALVLVRGDDRPAHDILTKLQQLASLHDGRPR